MSHPTPTKRAFALLALSAILFITSNPQTLYAQHRPQPGANPVQPGANPNQSTPRPNPRPGPAKPADNKPGDQSTGEQPADPDIDTPIIAKPRALTNDPRLLSPETWQEYSYGLSFQVPQGGTLDTTVSAQRIAAVVVPDKYEITLALLPIQSAASKTRGRSTDKPEDEQAESVNEYDLHNYSAARNAYRQKGDDTRKVVRTVPVPLVETDDFVSLKEVNQTCVNQQVRFLKASSYDCSNVRVFTDVEPPPPATQPAIVPATQPSNPDGKPQKLITLGGATTKPAPIAFPREKGFPAYLTYYYYAEKRANAKPSIESGKESFQPMIMGELIVLVSPTTFISARLRTKVEDFESTKPLFETFISSLKCMSQQQMLEMRKKLIQAGDEVTSTRKLPTSPQIYPGQQWFRIMEGDKDVGYMLITDGIDEQNKQKGVRVKVETRTYRGTIPFVTEGDFFLPHDKNLETWSIRLAEDRPGTSAPANTPGLGSTRSTNPAGRSTSPPGSGASRATTPAPTPSQAPVVGPGGKLTAKSTIAAPAPSALNWTETGTFDNHNKNVIVSRRSNAGQDTVEWTAPALGYLSQVQSLLIQRLLPVDKPGVYGFYCYSPQAGNIFFRTERVVPHPTGKGCTIYTRASPEQREIISQYDELGRLTQRDLPNGQSIKLTSPNEIAGIWAQKGLK
jgi:hypothetical protein